MERYGAGCVRWYFRLLNSVIRKNKYRVMGKGCTKYFRVKHHKHNTNNQLSHMNTLLRCDDRKDIIINSSESNFMWSDHDLNMLHVFGDDSSQRSMTQTVRYLQPCWLAWIVLWSDNSSLVIRHFMMTDCHSNFFRAYLFEVLIIGY